MIGKFLLYTSLLCPTSVFKGCSLAIVEMLKHMVIRFSTLTKILFCLFRDVKVLLTASLLLLEDNTCELTELVDFSPSQFQHVRLTESCKAREKECSFEVWIITLCSIKFLYVFPGKIFSLTLFFLEAFDATKRIVWDNTILEGLVDASLEFVEIR